MRDFYFDDKNWVIRYLIADTGNWLVGNKVLISPVSLGEPRWEDKAFPVQLTKQQIENSPSVSKEQPVSKQKESELVEYYDWPIYWPVGHTGLPPHISVVERTMADSKKESEGDPHLRSFHEIKGYNCQTSGENFGHIDDLIVADDTWTIRYLVIKTRTFLPGKKVLVSPMWAEKFAWSERKVYLSVSKNAIQNSPEFNPAAPINRSYEETLYDYYGRPVYWKEEFEKAATHF